MGMVVGISAGFLYWREKIERLDLIYPYESIKVKQSIKYVILRLPDTSEVRG